MASPLVSCLMVTQDNPLRHRFGQRAIRSFQAQRYRPRELVIIHQGTAAGRAESFLDAAYFTAQGAYATYTQDGYTIRELHTPPLTLGAARNCALDHATGAWCVPWDDDDWSHPDRLSMQVAYRDKRQPVVPTSYVAYSFLNNAAYVSRHRWCSGLMLFPRTDARYEAARGRSEDWVFMEQWPDRIAWPNPPQLYLRFYHGANTWDERHVMRQLAGPRGRNAWQLPAAARDYLKAVLAEHYPAATMGCG